LQAAKKKLKTYRESEMDDDIVYIDYEEITDNLKLGKKDSDQVIELAKQIISKENSRMKRDTDLFIYFWINCMV
jgi:maleate cis-trans isomerase